MDTWGFSLEPTAEKSAYKTKITTVISNIPWLVLNYHIITCPYVKRGVFVLNSGIHTSNIFKLKFHILNEMIP